jgi:hypothetical protein
LAFYSLQQVEIALKKRKIVLLGRENLPNRQDLDTLPERRKTTPNPTATQPHAPTPAAHFS